MKNAFRPLTVVTLLLFISSVVAQSPLDPRKQVKLDGVEKMSYKDPAFKAFMTEIKTAPLPDDQKLLLFRKIMPFAGSTEGQGAILREIGQLRTYQALFYVANYLNNPSLSKIASKSAMSIALPSGNEKEGMEGSMVREILTKAISQLSGKDRKQISQYLSVMPANNGFYPMFNGKDLTGWQGLAEDNPIKRAAMDPAELAVKQREANKTMLENWSVKDGCIWFSGKGKNLCSIKEYGDFELLVDWRITKDGDSGLYLRGSPQVQIWDATRIKVGSGGLFNNKVNMNNPLKPVDNPIEDWNSFRIIMTGEKVSVWLNGELVVDNVTMENYWDRSIPIFPKGTIELQAHGNELAFRDIYVREIGGK
jgi:hypothetical protein